MLKSGFPPNGFHRPYCIFLQAKLTVLRYETADDDKNRDADGREGKMEGLPLRRFLNANFVRECMPRGKRGSAKQVTSESWSGLRDPHWATCDVI